MSGLPASAWRAQALGTTSRDLAAICLLALLSGAALADEPAGATPLESYRVTTWTIADGLPQGTINSILQTKDGALWVATFGGLVRFDGVEFRTYDLDTLEGLPSNRITGLAPDDADGLWITSQAGHVLHFRGGVVIEMFAPQETVGETIAVVRDARGALWTRGSEGIVRRYADGSWTTPIPDGSPASPRDLCADHAGGVCASIGNDLVRFGAAAERIETLHAPARILAVAEGSEAGLWIGLVDGLAQARAGTIERIRTEPALQGAVTAIVEDGGSGLWLGTTDGPRHVVPEGSGAPGTSRTPERARETAWVLLPALQFPPAFEVRSLMRDQEGTLWVGTKGSGLARLAARHLTRFGMDESGGMTTALVDDGQGGAWIGSACKGLWHLVAGASRAVLEPLPRRGGEDPCVNSLLLDRRGILWIGETRGILRRVGREFLPLRGQHEFPGRVGPIVEAADGGVWFGTTQGHVVHLDPEGEEREAFDVPGEIVSLAPAADGRLWIGGEGVVFARSEGRLDRYGAEEGMPSGGVRDMLPDPDGSVWIATYGGGLGRLVGGRVTRIARAQGLPDNALSRILDDGRGRLWLLSNRGLIVAARDDLVGVATGRLHRLDPLVFGPEAGMPEANFGSPAGFRDPAGRFWFGTIAGVVRVDPGEFPFNRTSPPLRIERLLVEDRDLALSDPVEIPPDTRRLVFEFTAFSLSAPERVHFRYRLDPYDGEWVDGGPHRRASYTALNPGPYTFRVAARNEDGVWSEHPVSLSLRVLPSWWQTLVFRMSLATVVIGAFFAFHFLRTRTMGRRAQVLLEAAEARAAAEERASSLRAELAHVARVAMAGELATSLAHEVNQPLAAIVTNAQAGRRFLARDGIDRAGLDEILGDIAQQGQRASNVIRRLREFLRKNPPERHGLEVNAIIRDVLPLLKRELEVQRVTVELDLAYDLPPILADPVQIQQVLVNLVKNACEAMTTTPGERRVEIRTRARDGGIEVEVRDTGPGFAPDVAARIFQPFVTTKPDGMGMGLAICRSIVDAHDGRISAEPAAGSGIAVRVVFPAHPAGESAA